jgi:two-component system phosphate regulon sensor histidine kinase PhoR
MLDRSPAALSGAAEARPRQVAAGWTTANRLRKLVFACWAMLLLVSITAVGSLAVQAEHIRRLTLVDGPALDANNLVRQTMAEAQTGLNAYQVSGNLALLQPYVGAQERTTTALRTLDSKLTLGADEEADTTRHKVHAGHVRMAAEAWWANAIVVERLLSKGQRTDLSQNRVLFDRFKAANNTLGAYLIAERDRTRLSARTMSWTGEVIGIAVTFAALMGMLILGGRVAITISRPLTELRDTMVRQRMGEPWARAREDQGSLELRSVASDFNALTDQNLALREIQTRDLGTHEITLDIARAIRAAGDTQQALDFMCVALGEGLGVDRVIANTMGVRHEVQLRAQWHRADLPPLRDLTLVPEPGDLAEELWLSAGFRAQDNLRGADALPKELDRTFQQETGARAVILVPIGLDDRVIGMIYVFMVREPRAWSMAEANVVQAVAGFVAKAIVEAEHQEHQREYVDRIEKLDRQKSDFLATVSHELRTPLTLIRGYLEVLQEGSGELTVQQLRMLAVMSRNTVRLRSLIEDVLVLSRIEGGVSKADFVEVSIHEVITRVGEELTLLARESTIELEIDPGPRDAMVLGEKASLERAVLNVLANAIKFSRPGGVVTITATVDQPGGRAVITCEDHGVGIPAQDLPDLFTRFFRASNATEQAIPGTGLGLSIAKQIIEEHHGGELRLTSVEEEGTTVAMELPLTGMMDALPESLSESLPESLPGSLPESLPGSLPARVAAGNDSELDGVFRIRA